MPTAIAEMKLETQQLIRLLVNLQDDEVLTYEKIRQEIGVDVQQHAGILRTARRNAEKQTKRLFSTVIGTGIKRLVPGQSSGELTKSREHIRRTARRAFNRSTHVDFDQLTPEQRTVLNAERTVLHFAAEATSDKSTKKITTAVESSGAAITFQKTLEHFQGK